MNYTRLIVVCICWIALLAIPIANFIREKKRSRFKKTIFYTGICIYFLTTYLSLDSFLTSKYETRAANSDKQKIEHSLSAANAKIKELTPKPFKERLLAVLNEIDPSIAAQLNPGLTAFSKTVKPTTCRKLEALSEEKEAQGLFEMNQSVGEVYQHPGGKFNSVQFRVHNKILQ